MADVSAFVACRALAARRDQVLPGSPAALAKRIIPGYKITPTVALISDALVDAVENPDRRYIISCPPRSGKSVLTSQVLPIWALSRNPDELIILKSYADNLAEEHSREARRLIIENADLLGIELAADKSSAGRWQVAGHRGGLLAGGILTGTTGFGSSLLVVDDPVKNAVEADSAAHRRRLMAEFRASLLTRLHPGASVVILLTRWHENDVAGELLAEGGWTHINVPAVAEVGIPDALGRDPGVAMTSALGERSTAQWLEIRRAVGERAWFALYEGVPSSPEGGLVKVEWLDNWRLPAAPTSPVKTVVGVDPSDSGSGDSCGLIAASLTRDGVVALIADLSGPMTSDQWATAAVKLATDVGASEIAVEGFAARETYVRVVREALTRAKVKRPIKVSSWPPKASGRGGGDAIARSSALLQGLETGTVRLAGNFPALEQTAVQWQQGQHQPDALAALVVAHDVLVHSIGQSMTIVSPLDAERRMRRQMNHSIGSGEYDPLAYRRGVAGRPREATQGRPALDVR